MTNPEHGEYAEKAGQVLMAFFNELPAEAKDNKRLIFAERYDAIFNDSITADGVLLALGLFGEIERERKRVSTEIRIDPSRWDIESYIIHSSYYFLYLLKKLSELRGEHVEVSNRTAIYHNYPEAVELIQKAIEMEKGYLQKRKEVYSHRVFFKGARPKKHLDHLLAQWPDWRSAQ